MRRSPFKRQAPERKPAKQIGPGYTLRSRAVAVAVAGPACLVVPIPKEAPIQHAAYMDAVRSLPCDRCQAPPRSQFCHADEGKGAAIKTDCRRGWPGCAACHAFVGSTGKLGKAGRREFEKSAGDRTRAEVKRRGMWPATLPAWPGDNLGNA